MPRPIARSVWRPHLTHLEDRTTPFTVSGNTITLDVPDEILSISTSTAGTYSLSSYINLVGIPRQFATFTPAAGLVTLEDTATGTGVTFRDSTAEYVNPFAVTLDHRPFSVWFNGRSAFGANDLTVTTTRSIFVSPSPNEVVSVTTTSGNITFSANMQATPTTGGFAGVNVVASSVTSVSGAVNVSGRGGDGPNAGGSFQIGVYVIGGATLGSTGSGNVTVTGIGGASTFNNNFGVQVVGDRGAVASITSGGGNVTVTGTGGGVRNSVVPRDSNINRGVFVNLGGKITAGGTGAVSVTGTGGTAGTSGNAGVYVTDIGSEITSSGGAVSVTGSGGGTAANSAFDNHGVIVAAGGRVSAGGGGAVNVGGRGNTSGIDSGPLGNVGVFVTGGGSAVTSGGGPVDIQGTDGSSFAVLVQDGGTVASTANAPVTFTTDTLEVSGNGNVSAGTGTVTIQTLTPTAVISLGGADSRSNSLGLLDRELDRVTAGTLVIGRSDTAGLRIVAPITRPTATDVRLITAGDLLSDFAGRFDTAGGPLTLAVGTISYTPPPTTSRPARSRSRPAPAWHSTSPRRRRTRAWT